MTQYLVLNAHMYGRQTEPGEHVDWSAPDLFTASAFRELLGQDPADYAAQSPHMIVAEIPRHMTDRHDPERCTACLAWRAAGRILDDRVTA